MTLHYLDIVIGFSAVMLGVSLLITVISQLISGLLGLRGSNLRWGIKTLLENAHPDLQKQAKTIADNILRHPLVSDSTFSKFSFLGLVGRWRLSTAIRRQELVEIISALSKMENPPEWAARLKAYSGEVQAVVTNWFDRTMDRVSQRFAMSMRYWTVVIALLLTAILHLDAIALLKKLSSDSALRVQLVASSDSLLKQGATILGAQGQTNVFRAALEQFRQKNPEAANILTNPPPLLNHESAHLWLRQQLGDNAQAQRLRAEYGQLVISNLVARAPELTGSMGMLQDELARAGLQLVPDYKAIRWRDYSPLRLSFWGMLASVSLLSLGAPFWFNAVKSLMNLRPVLANRVQKEREGDKPSP